MTLYYYVKYQPKVLMIALVQQKKFRMNFSKARTLFCLNLHYKGTINYLYVNKTDIYKFKTRDNIIWCEFCLESISNILRKMNTVKFTVYDFSVDNSSIGKEYVLNIH